MVSTFGITEEVKTAFDPFGTFIEGIHIMAFRRNVATASSFVVDMLTAASALSIAVASFAAELRVKESMIAHC